MRNETNNVYACMMRDRASIDHPTPYSGIIAIHYTTSNRIFVSNAQIPYKLSTSYRYENLPSHSSRAFAQFCYSDSLFG